MAMIQFVANTDDLSTDRGFQFRFHCDKCGNGYMSRFQPSVTGIAGGLLHAAGNLFGGVLGRVGDSAYEIQRAVGGKAHDDALMKAVEEGRQHFKQCSRCGRWVCPEACWNAERGLCEECAPDVHEELAAAQAQATAGQIHEKARATNYVADMDMKSKASAQCPHCGGKTKGGKFCPECGGALKSNIKCKRCGNENDASDLFCPQCGEKVALQ
jgi:hypothetical protein